MTKRDGRAFDHKTLEAIRIRAVQRIEEDGETPSEVMRALGFARTVVYINDRISMVTLCGDIAQARLLEDKSSSAWRCNSGSRLNVINLKISIMTII